MRQESNDNKRNFLSKRDIVNDLYHCIPVDLHHEKVEFYEKTNQIRIGRHLYSYYVRDGHTIFTETRVKNGELYEILLKSNRKKKESLKVKSNTGKIRDVSFLMMFGAVLLISVASAKHFLKKEISVSSTLINQQNDVKDDLNETNFIDDEIIIETQNTYDSDILLFLDASPTDAWGFQKRENIILNYENLIEFYSEKYGLDKNFVIDLIAQESHNPLDSVSQEEKNNMGQLTSVICSEPIVAPVFQNNQLAGYEGYFILPGDYPKLPVSNLNDIDESYLNEIQIENLKRARRQEHVIWTVYSKEEAFYQVQENLRVSIAYLSYLVNKSEDLILGAMSYHSGYSKTSGLSREQVINGEVDAMDSNYISNIIRYEPFEHYQDGFFFEIQLQSGEKKIYRIRNKSLESEQVYEKENGYHL